MLGPSTWRLLNNTTGEGKNAKDGNSVRGMGWIAQARDDSYYTPEYSFARTLAQFTDPGNVFNAVVGSDGLQCGNSFLLLLADLFDSSQEGLDTPYLSGSTTDSNRNLAISAGNQALIGDPNMINPRGTSPDNHHDLPTLAAAAAHLGDASLGTVGTDYLAALDPGTKTRTDKLPTFLPFAIKQRNAVTLNPPRLVTTMTMNVSPFDGEGLRPLDQTLFLTAALGNPARTTGSLSDLHPFNGWEQPLGEATDPNNDWIPDPDAPGSYPAWGISRSNAVYSFDGTDPDTLMKSMDFAVRLAISARNQPPATASVAFTGAPLGQQLYLGQAKLPTTSGRLWSGDLLMFGTREVAGEVKALDKSGNVTTTLTAANAQWSASAALLAGKVGTARNLFTRIPGGTALKAFTDSNTNSAFDNLKAYVGTSATTESQKMTLIQHAAGADIGNLGKDGRPTKNRANIMGDILNSTPAALEYKWSDIESKLSSYSALKAVGGSRFRMVLVGTNQGWLHAFGEVTKTDASTGQITGAAVQELWSFLPTDFLKYLDYLLTPGSTHRYLVDGSPTLYHLDLPPSGGGAGNGLVDSGERAVAIFGLGKGGRSYYALNILDPFNPTLKWALVPEEATTFPPTLGAVASTLTLATAKGLLEKFGFSTPTPALGRVQDANGVLRDAVFLGGGFSVPEVDIAFGKTLGRSVMALDVSTGKVLAAADLSATTDGTASGPVGAGLIPFEFVLNSGMAQRAYFLDYKGGLWAWGSKATVDASAVAKDATLGPFLGFRVDTAKVSAWDLRKVYQDDDNVKNARYTTSPAPFRVGQFPGAAKTDRATPAAVGIAMVSGDRNNPMDLSYTATNPAPTQHRLTVVFDRQDTSTGLTTANLKNFTANEATSASTVGCEDAVFKLITPGCPDYFLAGSSPSSGYYVNFQTGVPVSKGINTPLVVAGALFYATYTPGLLGPCGGGAGTTNSSVIADVMRPLVSDSRTGLSSNSGSRTTWAGVTSDFVAVGTRGALQVGMQPQSTPAADGSMTPLTLTTLRGAAPERFAKPRVWRTVH